MYGDGPLILVECKQEKVPQARCQGSFNEAGKRDVTIQGMRFILQGSLLH